jgi:hypothetical protein
MSPNRKALERIIHQKEEEEEKKSFEEKKRIQDIIRQFIADNNLIMYGGVALNSILPKKYKFYGPKDFPDYDCLSSSAKKHAIDLANIFASKGFEYTEVRNAIHDHTFKVYVNFVSVADFTQVSQKFFYQMLRLSETQNMSKNHDPRVNVAPLFLLKHFILKELARPEGSYHRWTKVYERSKQLDKMMKFKKTEDVTSMPMYYPLDDDTKAIFKDTLEVLKLHKLPLVGNFGLGVLLGKNTKDKISCCKVDEFFSAFEVLSNDPQETLETITKFVKFDTSKYEIVTSKRFFYHEILPKRLRVYLKEKGQKKVIKLMTIIHTDDNCYSYMVKSGITIGSPFTILQMLYAYWLVYYVYEDPKIPKNILSMISALEDYIKTISMNEKFILNCFGHEKTMMNVKRERWQDNKKTFLYRPKS